MRKCDDLLYSDSRDVRGSDHSRATSSSIVLELKSHNRLAMSRQLLQASSDREAKDLRCKQYESQGLVEKSHDVIAKIAG